MVVTSLPSLGQGEKGSDFSNFKRNLHHEKKIVIVGQNVWTKLPSQLEG